MTIPSLNTLSIASKDLCVLSDLSSDEFAGVLALAAELKSSPDPFRQMLAGRSVALLFEKDSLRTRCSFEVGIHRLGGQGVYMDHAKQRIGERESVADYAGTLERYFDAIVARVYDHTTVAGLAAAARVPVVNALCNLHHPCQALADFQTLVETLAPRFARGANSRGISEADVLRRIKLAYVGEPNNVSNSLLHAAALCGATLTLVAPPGCGTSPAILEGATRLAERTGATLRETNDPAAVRGHHAIYTDTWFSMGSTPKDDAERQARLRLFRPYQVNAELMSLAGPDALFMHCLPAGRGIEVTDEVMDSPNSVVFDQAENRLHAQNALLVGLLASRVRHT